MRIVALVLSFMTFTLAAHAQKPPALESLDAAARWRLYVKETIFSPSLIVSSASQAAGAQFSDIPPEWGQGGEAYGRRAASRLGVNFLRESIEHAGAAAFGRDPVYRRCPCKGFFNRTGHAILSGFATRNAAGKLRLRPVRIGSYYGATMAEVGWFPSRYGWKDGFRSGTQLFVVGLGRNLYREFLTRRKKK